MRPLQRFMSEELLLIVDFGSQFTQLIARRLRDAGFYAEIVPHHRLELNHAQHEAVRGVVLSGGPSSAVAESAPQLKFPTEQIPRPLLGICYGSQSLVAALGGTVAPSSQGAAGEYGKATLQVREDYVEGDSPPMAKKTRAKKTQKLNGATRWQALWHCVPRSSTVWMSHGDSIVRLPEGFVALAASERSPLAALGGVGEGGHVRIGLQFHPEVSHTEHGAQILVNFARHYCHMKGDFRADNLKNSLIAKIRSQIGKGKVLCAVSGGVDSTVTARLVHEACGESLHCVFVDHGLLRAGEGAEVRRYFARLGIELAVIDASARFFAALKGAVDPERKRKIIGELFIKSFENHASQLARREKIRFMAQGTLYPDVIESIDENRGGAMTIKSHHNVGGLPKHMGFELVEPLRKLFKDEVRALGQALGVPAPMLKRHPFPGPGLAIRIPGEVTPEKCECLRRVDNIFIDMLRAAKLYDKIWQAFAVLLPVRSVGVMGDGRSYEHACSLRAICSTDGMTAEPYDFDPAFLRRVATRIVNEVDGVNRVLYDVTAKPPATIEWE